MEDKNSSTPSVPKPIQESSIVINTELPRVVSKLVITDRIEPPQPTPTSLDKDSTKK